MLEFFEGTFLDTEDTIELGFFCARISEKI